MIYRSIENANISDKNIGETVKVIGWVSKKRDLGKLTFVDLRDRSGIIQILINEDTPKPEIRNEFILQVEGIVRLKEVANSQLKTGHLEIVATKVVLINKAKTPPLIIANETDALDDVRLKYRYLDLRRPVLQEKLMTRAKIAQVTRRFLDNDGFIEIETPILTKSTPGGARDYLVPSRLNPGTFYALAQSPQIYKQLLMIGGLEKYYQIARCFRDEDLRADRQPDFTQIDIETSFFSYEELLHLLENLIATIFKEVKGVNLKLPLKRLSYEDAMHKYGSDKPDLRFDLQIKDIKEVVSNDPFFANYQFIKALVVKNANDKISRKVSDGFNLIAKQHGLDFFANLKVVDGLLAGSLAKYFDEKSSQKLVNSLELEENDVVFVSLSSKERNSLTSLGALRNALASHLNLIDVYSYSVLWVDRFPLFSYDKESGKYASEHHPFTMPLAEDAHKLATKPEEVLSYAYDIVINGYEAGGGSMRIYDQDMQARIFEILGMNEQEISEKFGFFIEALKYGTPPHGGFAFGLDRMSMILTGTDDIKDVIAFPKNLKGNSLMSEEPGPVSSFQLDELYIKIEEGSEE